MYCVFQGMYYGGIYVDYLVFGCVCVMYLLDQFGIDIELFLVYDMFVQVIYVYWLECVGVYMQGYMVEGYFLCCQGGQQCFVEMQFGGGCGYCIDFVGEYGLVVFVVVQFGFVLDVGW